VLLAPTGETLLYDAGSLSSPESAARMVASYLWHRGITRIDGIVISHADVDHFNAVPSLLEQFRVGAIYVSPVMFDEIGLPGVGDATEQERADRPLPVRDAQPPTNQLSGPAELRRAIEIAGVPIREIWADSRLQLGPKVVIDVLHPPRRGVIGNDNANSLTLVVEHEGQRVLLPGDLESPGIEDLMAELPHDCDVLLAPHHGSRRSDPPGFAAWSTPEWVVVSCGNVDVGPAVRSYGLAGATAFQTNLDGTITFSLGRRPLDVATWRARN
jgi:competence protein ComEC